MAFNANILLVPTNKRNADGKRINSELPINDDCWRNICERLNWSDWTKLCLAYPQFSKFIDGKSIQTLILEMGTILCRPLAENAHIIKNVIIDDGPREYNYIDILENYDILTAIESLVVVGAEHPLTYIKSENIKYLAISTVYQNDLTYTANLEQLITTDFLEPLLAISKNIEQIHIGGSHISENSFKYLSQNPIRRMILADISIASPDHLGNFLSQANHLTHIELWSSGSVEFQNYFWNTDNTARQRIKSMSVVLLPGVNQNQYHNIRHFTNLEDIRIIYTDWEKLELFLGSLTHLENLKSIQSHAFLSATSEDLLEQTLTEDQTLFDDYEDLHKRRNIIITRFITTYLVSDPDQDPYVPGSPGIIDHMPLP